MIYFRVTYDLEFDGPENHPIVEVIKGDMKSKDYETIHYDLSRILQPSFLENAIVRILKK